MESAETACPHTTPDPLEPAPLALGGALTETEWDTLLARSPEGSVERAKAITLLLDVAQLEQIDGLPLRDLVQVLWMLEDGNPAQEALAALVASRRPTFEDWVSVVTRLPQYRSTASDTFALRCTLEQMHAVATGANWVWLTHLLLQEKPAIDPKVSVFYRAVIRNCGLTATKMRDLLVAFRCTRWDVTERMAIFERLLALSPNFATTLRDLDPLAVCGGTSTEPGEISRLSSRHNDRLYEQAKTYEQYRALVHIAGDSLAAPWHADALHALASRSSTFAELVDTLAVSGNDNRVAPAVQLAEQKLRALIQSSPRPFAEWMEIAQWRCQFSRTLYALALREAYTTASTTNELLELLLWAVAPRSPLHRRERDILRRILREPLTTAEYRRLLKLERDAPRRRRRIFHAMATQPLDLERAYLLTVLAPAFSPASVAGAQYLAEVEAPFTAWDALLDIRIEDSLRPSAQHRQCPDGVDLPDADYPERCRFVLRRLTALAQTEREWCRVLDLATETGVANVQVAARRALALLLRQSLAAAPAPA